MLSPKSDDVLREKINASINDVKNQEFFDSLRTRIGGRVQDTAFLSAAVDKAIYGYKSASEANKGFLLPRNTKVLVVEWGGSYTAAMDRNNKEQSGDRSRVKLLSGPLRGKIVWVNNEHITLGY